MLCNHSLRGHRFGARCRIFIFCSLATSYRTWHRLASCCGKEHQETCISRTLFTRLLSLGCRELVFTSFWESQIIAIRCCLKRQFATAIPWTSQRQSFNRFWTSNTKLIEFSDSERMNVTVEVASGRILIRCQSSRTNCLVCSS